MSPPTLVNLEHSRILLIDDNQQTLDILGSIMQGFGVKEQVKCSSAVDAQLILKQRTLDLILIDCASADLDSYGFTRWLRREAAEPVRYLPLIILTGHANESKVLKSRDCGANFVVIKPLTPAVLLQRIMWLAHDERPFIDCESYAGPDRRTRNMGPPTLPGRRKDDLVGDLGAAMGPNLGQQDIDSMLKPQRVALP